LTARPSATGGHTEESLAQQRVELNGDRVQISYVRIRRIEKAGRSDPASARILAALAGPELAQLYPRDPGIDPAGYRVRCRSISWPPGHQCEEAVRACRAALEVRAREHRPLHWVQRQHALGAALMAWGDVTDAAEPLEEAVAADRAALEERTRQRRALLWAMTSFDLAMPLQILGARDAGRDRLEQSP
jgi:hypothetical protein